MHGNFAEKWDTEVLRYKQACMLEKKENYHTELSDIITIFNDNKNTLLSSMNILKAIFKVIIENEEESITEANNVSYDAFSYASSSYRENPNAIFTSEKLEKLDELVDAINNLTINNTGYELNTATASDAQGDLTSDPDIVTHTSNVILDQNILSCQTYGEVSVLPPPTNPTIILTPQILLTTAVKEIFAGTTSVNTWTNRSLLKIISTGVDKYIPISTSIHSGMRKYSNPAPSDSTVTRISIRTTSPPCGINVSLKIDNIRQSATPYLRKSNKLDTSIDGKFTNILAELPIFIEVLCDKISDIFIQDLYTRRLMNLAAHPVNIPAPQFVDLGLLTIDALDKVASIWTPATRVGRPTDFSHWITPDHIFVKTTAVEDNVSAKSNYNYKTDFETWR